MSANFICLSDIAYLASYPENALHGDVNRTTIESPQRTRIFKASHCLKVHNAPLILTSSISG